MSITSESSSDNEPDPTNSVSTAGDTITSDSPSDNEPDPNIYNRSAAGTYTAKPQGNKVRYDLFIPDDPVHNKDLKILRSGRAPRSPLPDKKGR
ncbi:hypothetical protein BGZ73_002316, partial [Actinomortierella ambigua]